MAEALHENLADDEGIVGPSNRKFGLTMGAIFAALALWKLWAWSPWFYVWAALAIVLGGLALASPRLLSPLNTAWLKLGLLLYRVVNPVIMAILLYGAIMPIGLLLRATGKDLLRLKKEPDAKTYWLTRAPDRPLPESMRQQF